MANNGIFYSSGNTLNFTTNSTTWATLSSGGTFAINTVSGGTYLNLPNLSGTYLPLSGGTVTGATIFQSGLTSNTISATTYYNLPTDVFVTGGTYTSGNAIFTNNTGGTFTVTGFAIGGGGGQLFYLNLSQSQGSNRLLSTTGSTASEQTTGVTINNGVTGSIASFQSQPLNITLLPGGIWSFYLHSYKQNTNASFDIFVEVYKRTSGGTQTLLFSTDPTPVTTNSPNPSMQLSDSYFSGTTLLVSDSIVATVRATNTSNQSHTITLVTEGSTHYSYVVSTIPTQQGLTCDTLSGCTIIQTIQTDLTNKLDKSGGTISGGLVVNSGLTATTISATTYQNLPVSALTGTNGIAVSNSNSNFTLRFTGGTITGSTNFTSGLTATTISATTTTSDDLIVNNSFEFITPSYYSEVRTYNNLVIFDANSLVTPISNEGFGGDENLVSGAVFLTLSNDSDSRAIEILYTLRSTNDDDFRSGKIIANWDRTYTNFYQTEYGPNYDLTTMTFIDPPRVFYGGSGTIIRVKIDFDDVTDPTNLLTARFKYTLI